MTFSRTNQHGQKFTKKILHPYTSTKYQETRNTSFINHPNRLPMILPKKIFNIPQYNYDLYLLGVRNPFERTLNHKLLHTNIMEILCKCELLTSLKIEYKDNAWHTIEKNARKSIHEVFSCIKKPDCRAITQIGGNLTSIAPESTSKTLKKKELFIQHVSGKHNKLIKLSRSAGLASIPINKYNSKIHGYQGIVIHPEKLLTYAHCKHLELAVGHTLYLQRHNMIYQISKTKARFRTHRERFTSTKSSNTTQNKNKNHEVTSEVD